MKKLLIGSYILIIIIIIFCIANSHIFDRKKSDAIAAGEKVYSKNCLICHGENGKGEGSKGGTALNNQHFLSNVSNKDLYNYIKYGRVDTAMPAYGPRLSDKDLNNLVAYIRDWQTKDLALTAPKNISGDSDRGKKIYNLYCLTCHGEAGAGRLKVGPALANPQYLKYTTDKQIWADIAYGRENTRMGPSLKGLEGARQLSKQDITDIVTYIRSLHKN
jgi:cytochrome c oxidase cbb3-type subunit 3